MADLTPPIIKHLGLTDFSETCAAMQAFTKARHAQTTDEIWVTEHAPVYSLGLNRKNTRMPTRHDIPVVECDRGGKITYHGPGQVIVYVLLDLQRYGLSIRQLVTMMENSVIAILAKHVIQAASQKDAPGVYVDGAKIASLGLRMKQHYCYHGLSLNVNMDLSPFAAIDPCGYANLPMTQMAALGVNDDTEAVTAALLREFQSQLLHHQS